MINETIGKIIDMKGKAMTAITTIYTISYNILTSPIFRPDIPVSVSLKSFVNKLRILPIGVQS